MLLNVHKTFIKTGKKIHITKFQKVELLFGMCVFHLHIYTYVIFAIIFHYE